MTSDGVSPPVDVVEVGFALDGEEHRLPLTEVWSVPFETCSPARSFPSYRGQRHFPGLWWSATTGRHVGFESWLERDRLMLLDFDPDVVGISSQPFWLLWTADNGRTRSHAPDYFARLADGRGLVVDVRPPDRIKPSDAVAFDLTRCCCDALGWDYTVLGADDEVLVANVRWLAGYRHPRHQVPELAGQLRTVFASGLGLHDGAERVGDPIAVLPVLFHLLWQHELHASLSRPLHPDTLVTTVDAGVRA
ncbi:TnsA-like heteromeric transposase endonuclease subunit [Saccharopolyspora sp. K220]|uniref:TnsA-like heteromeric transposase endonuclease subunit n=1 Tax=Saccharopolyspora soli TaxID=2926618 RepID=UPI001F569F19|nr:TnsA-like heteromeric transposase endonuclease subunit [Saccharopolyspora soli]MCI2421091.1 TnsA-like heteromeric transposase endonuclease subunit [Saccharopolyspora soli]